MKLYSVRFDGMDTYVEARHFGEAIELWRVDLQAQNGGEFENDVEPEQVVLVHDEPVLRRKL